MRSPRLRDPNACSADVRITTSSTVSSSMQPKPRPKMTVSSIRKSCCSFQHFYPRQLRRRRLSVPLLSCCSHQAICCNNTRHHCPYFSCYLPIQHLADPSCQRPQRIPLYRRNPRLRRQL